MPAPADLPRPPTPPDPQECCQRGCDPCILDYYDRAMERWEARVRALGCDPAEVLARQAQPDLGRQPGSPQPKPG